MKKYFKVLSNEEGSAIVIALLVLLAVTVIGISSTTTSTTELRIVRNEQIYNTNLYQAEAAAKEAVQQLADANRRGWLVDIETPFVWLSDANTSTADFFNNTSTDWATTGTGTNAQTSAFVAGVGIPQGMMAAVNNGVLQGSIDTESITYYTYQVFGISNWNNGEVVIEMGYIRKAPKD